MKALLVVTLFSGLSFIFYGFSCLYSKKMKAEFIRFRIPQYRKITGLLQILGGSSLVIGYLMSVWWLSFIGALGLAVLMALGFFTRLRIKDSLPLSAPALLFSLLNAFLAFKFYTYI
ncbi:DoxX family protein [Nonlabens tegetincola]|uniref:DoxX family protein n=2 Tax=Nonlabens TaxID=363408 RepID=UPI000CF578F4|nr:DoxX family protein [Nonlabens tegetincola]PQJ16980.1 hypothetical protein BST93_09905 [Nonlabens tegetincola]